MTESKGTWGKKESSWGRDTQQGAHNGDFAENDERRAENPGESPLVSQIITLLNSLSPPSLKHCILMS